MAKRRSVARRKNQGVLGNAGVFARRSFTICLIVGALGCGYLGASMWKQIQELPDVTMVERFEPIEAIQIMDKQDHLICTVEGDEDRRVVPLNQISTKMQQAILAAEDHHFYEHNGINFFSIFRASMANMAAGHVKEGGSTITQQLAKNLFFADAGRTYDRKIKEAYVAWDLERRYSKERILNMYLNQVYFGNNAYGIERAASRYFDRSAAQLSLAQAAFLAGLVKAPSELGLPQNRAAAYSRQKEIIDKMVEYGYITESQAKEAKGQQLAFKKGTNSMQKYPYYISYVLQVLRERFSQAEMRRQGLRVYTNLDPVAQELAEKALNAGIKKAPKGVTQGALVSVSVSGGEVVALVGGVGNFWKNQFNRATNPHTVGSSFKPFVYLTAFCKNVFGPDSMIDDSPLVIKSPWGQAPYAPKNFDHKFYGRIQIRRALALSRNVPAVKVGQQVGMESVIETARLAGITAKLDPNLSLALGSSAASPLEMAGAYSTFARFGIAIKPQVIRKIENNRGQVIEVFDPRADRAFQVEPVARLVECMQDCVRWGTGTQAKLADRPVAGKTGTADEGKDIWFIGFTPDMVTAVWGGNDENKAIEGKNVTGGVIMAKIWHDYNEAYYKARPTAPGSFMAPSQFVPDEKKGGDQLAKNPDATPKDETASTVNATGDGSGELKAEAQSLSTGNSETAPTPGTPIQAETTVTNPSSSTSSATTTTTSSTTTSSSSSTTPALAPAIGNSTAEPKVAPEPAKDKPEPEKRLLPYAAPTLWMPVAPKEGGTR
ncbi:MAG: PBP1A family penicillin-binding protein [Candidatus Obscuribacterales bacterium]